MSPLLLLSVKEGVPSVHVGVEPSRCRPRVEPPLSTLNVDLSDLHSSLTSDTLKQSQPQTQYWHPYNSLSVNVSEGTALPFPI
jgi:hypothetical protein